MSLDKYLEGLSEQDSVKEKNAFITSSQSDVLLEKFEEWMLIAINTRGRVEREGKRIEFIQLLKYSSKDVGEFSLRVGKIKDQYYHMLGGERNRFLYDLINCSEENVFTIIPKDFRLNGISAERNKKITIIGNSGQMTGCGNKGLVVVKGNCSDQAGFSMLGGELLIEGNSGVSTGQMMSSGKIVVLGNTERNLGISSYAGEIHVNGEIKEISDDCKAKIYHKGKLIWPE